MIEDTSSTYIYPTIPILTTTMPRTTSTAVPIEDDNVIWEDPDLDFVVVEPTPTTSPIPTTTFSSSPVPSTTEIVYDTDDEYEFATAPSESVEHFEFIQNNPPSSTISGGVANIEQESPLNWWDLNESSIPPLIEPTDSIASTTPSLSLISSTIDAPGLEEDDWMLFNSSAIPLNIPSDNLADLNSEVELDMNDYFLLPAVSTTPPVQSIRNGTPSFLPFFFPDQKNKDHLFDLMKPMPTLAMPPFSWMLQLARQNRSKSISRQHSLHQNATTKIKKKRIDLQRTSDNNEHDQFYEYCHKKQCQHGGRLNSDCLCICLPAFNGHHCEKGIAY